MNEADFVVDLRNAVVDSNVAINHDLFESTSPADATDAHWQAALRWYGELDASRREVLFSVIRQVMVDTISNVLAIVDGVSTLPNRMGDFVLSYDGEAIQGNLQASFLELEERRS